MSRKAVSNLRPIDAVSFIRTLRGGSQSVLIRGSDGLLYKTKFYKNPQGPNVLANEWIGTALAASVGLPVAPSVMIRVSEQFLDQHPELVFHYADRTERLGTGIQFGSLYLGQDDKMQRLLQYLPRSQRRHLFNPGLAVGIALFDILTIHADDRQAIFTKHPTKAKILATYVDFGHLFGGPNWGSVTERWLNFHYTSSGCPELWTEKAISSWIAKFQAKIPRSFSSAKPEVPRCWHDGNLDQVEDRLLNNLESLPAMTAMFHFAQDRQRRTFEYGNIVPTRVGL